MPNVGLRYCGSDAIEFKSNLTGALYLMPVPYEVQVQRGFILPRSLERYAYASRRGTLVDHGELIG